jgi:transcriptional regulator with XRE-family HTH domain
MSEVWPKKYLDRRRELKRAGDKVGLLKLQFGHYVFQMRTLVRELTQDKAAKLAGISRSQWIKMEKGLHLPRPHKIPDIADAIETDVDALYRKARLEIPRKYAKYDLEAARKEFEFVLQASSSFQGFIYGVQLIWQKYGQDKTGKRQPFYIDHHLPPLLDLIYCTLSVSQQIKLAHALVQDVKRRDIKAVIPNGQQFLDDLDSEMERASNATK